MTYAQVAPAAVARGSSRWLLLGSLALNLFFAGAAIALFIREPAAPAWDRNVLVRIEHLADTLPPADANLLRGRITTNRAAIEAAQSNYRASQSKIRDTLRVEPFDTAAMQAAMTETRAARQNFDQVLQGVFGGAAAQMSSAGRHALADWPPGRKSAGAQQ